MKNPAPRKIATFASAQIGDTLMATSLYQALRIQYPNAELTLLSQVAQHPVLSGFNTFDLTVDYHSDLNLDELYDLVVLPVFCGDSAVNANFNRFQNVISLDRLHGKLRRSWRNKWDGTFTHLLFYKHQFELNADLARAFGYLGDMPLLYCPQGDPARYDHLKRRIGLFINTPQNKFQALPNRQWPLTHWQDLIQLLCPANVILVGAESDLPNLQRLATETGAAFEATATLSDFTAVCRNLKTLVTTDGGGMHAAATTGVPIVSLHGTSSPILLHPWIYPEGKCVAVVSPNACSPCQRSYRLLACEIGLTQMDCMQNIRSEFVERAIIEVDKLKAGTCLVMKGEELMTKTAYLRDWKRALTFKLNYDWARIAVRLPSRGRHSAPWNESLENANPKSNL